MFPIYYNPCIPFFGHVSSSNSAPSPANFLKQATPAPPPFSSHSFFKLQPQLLSALLHWNCPHGADFWARTIGTLNSSSSFTALCYLTWLIPSSFKTLPFSFPPQTLFWSLPLLPPSSSSAHHLNHLNIDTH